MVDPRPLDSVRSYHLYRYLIGRLAISRSEKGAPNNQQTAKRVGDDNLRKIISAVLSNQEAWHSTVSLESKNARLTTGRVANMLGELRAALNREYKAHDVPYSRVLTTEDILVALCHLTELAPEERSRLNLPNGDKLTLLKQTLLSLQTKEGSDNHESIAKAYKEAVGLDFTGPGTAVNNLNEVNALIEDSVRAALSYLPNRPSRFLGQVKAPSNEETIIELSRKAQREVRRLLMRSGNTQVFLINNETDHSFIKHYLQPAFVKKLSQTVVNNERLTAQLPVYLKQITTESRGPLPFFDNSLGAHKYSNSYPDLLDKKLQALDGQVERLLTEEIPQPNDYDLASQEVTKLTLSFYIKVDKDYKSVSPDTFDKIASSNNTPNHPYRRVDFEYSSTGIGGTLSHLVKVINTTLLKDIPCLNRFFPIAHDVTSTQTIIRDNVSSPIWAHSLVKLCHNDSVGDALYTSTNDLSSYDDFSFGDPIGHGDFCGFDFMIAQAQSAVQARLQAILNTGVSPQLYIQQLCEKVERQMTLKQARQMLKYYPFSSMAMMGTIRQKILKPAFEDGRSLQNTDADIYFNAYLSIAEALLDEGAYRAAYPNLQKVSVLESCARNSLALQGSADIDRNRCEVFSSQLIIRYLLCQAIYYYLYDLDGPITQQIQDEFSSQVTRQQLVSKSWEMLAQAEAQVRARLRKYLVVGEVSQGTFAPHYKLMSRIFLLRARLLTFFPRMVPKAEALLPTENFSGQQRTEASVHWGKLYLLEKARLYIAAEGDGELYAYYAALQSCYYLTAAYADPKNLTVSNTQTGESRSLDYDHCMIWAKRLRDHALLAYGRTGRHCYNAIKEKSGLPEESEPYGYYNIQKLPAIFEDRGMRANRKLSEQDDFLTLDISFLAINQNDLPKLTPHPPSKNIYLFGTNACHIFLARGLYMLCGNTSEEFSTNETNMQSEIPINWHEKLRLAGRLFDLAWAVAEDGCSLERDKTDRRKKNVTRTFKSDESSTQYTTREIDSVRDLYPRRISEVADTGKLYSVACKVLQLHLLPAAQRHSVIEDIEKLYAMLHGQYRLRTKRFMQVSIHRQHRYNGHLEHFLSHARNVLDSHMPTSDIPADSAKMHSIRNQLMKELFATLLQ